jgi:hypothetical protein
MQQIGRGTRLAPGKVDCLVLDLAGASDHHNLAHLGEVSLGSLVGLKVKDGASVLTSALADRGRRERLEALLSEHGRLVAEDMDLFGRRQLRWLTLPGPTAIYVLGAGSAGHVVLVSDGAATFAAYQVPLEGDALLLRTGLRTDQATVLAEQVVVAYGAGRLVDIEARWRKLPASDKQVAVLRSRYGASRKVLASLSRGQASDLIDAFFAAKRLRQTGVVA